MKDATMGEGPVWQALVNSQITLTMNKLLNLVPWFWQEMENHMRRMNQVMMLTNFAKSMIGPIVVDHHNLAIKVILLGEKYQDV